MADAQAHKDWYLLQTKPRHEAIAQSNLERQGYENYFPRVRANRKLRGKFRDVIEPLFPGYIFIKLNSETDNWSPIRSTRGVRNIVRFGGSPALVNEELVQYIRDKDNEEGVQVLPQQSFTKGQQVIISQGPLAGYEAIYQCASSKDRVIVLLNVLSQKVKMQLSKHDLEYA